jgi:Arc/MetJ family transcription regulator
MQGVFRMRTNIVLDPALIARAMRKAGATTMRETIDIALREYVSKPDYDALLKLSGMGAIDPDYDPKAGDQPAVQVAEATATYRSDKRIRRQPTRR